MSYLSLYDLSIVGTYLPDLSYFKKLSLTCRKFKGLFGMYHYNPVPLTSIKEITLFDKLETLVILNYNMVKFYNSIRNKYKNLIIIIDHDIINVVDGYKVSAKVICYKPQTIISGQKLEFVINNNVTIKKLNLKYENVKELDYNFGENAEFEEVILPDKTEEISGFGFSHANELTRVKFNDKLRKINSLTFINTKLKFANITSVTIIEHQAFQYCYSLQKVVLPEGIKEIGSLAFKECKCLRKINFPSTLEFIDDHAFSDCGKLHSANLSKTKLTRICSGTFENCYNLRHVLLPETITSIEYSAFFNCERLRQINFPKSLTVIEEYAFRNVRFKHLKLSDNVEVYGGAFDN